MTTQSSHRNPPPSSTVTEYLCRRGHTFYAHSKPAWCFLCRRDADFITLTKREKQ